MMISGRKCRHLNRDKVDIGKHSSRFGSHLITDLFLRHNPKHRLFPVKTRQYSEDYHSARPRLPPGTSDAGVEEGVSPDHPEN